MFADVAEQPLPSVIVTEYGPSAVAKIVCVVSPDDQRYDAAAGAESTTEPPLQKVVELLAEIVATGAGFIVTAKGAEVEEQPAEFVTVTVKDSVALTTIDWVIAPFDQAYADPVEATKVTEPP